MRRLIVASFALFGLAACSSSTGTTPGGGSVASVSVSPAADTIVLSQSVQLTASAKDASGAAVAGAAIEWSVAPTSVATISSAGVVTGLASGTASVTAASAGKSAVAIIVVREGGLVGSAGGTVTGSGGAATLVIPPNALLASLPISVQQSVAPPAAALLIPGTAFEFGPTGTQFAQPITIKLHYDPGQVPAQADPSQLRLYLQTGSSWTLVPGSSVDTAAHVVTGTTTHFSGYVVCMPPCGVGLPAIYLNVIPPAVVAPGSTYTYVTETGGVAYLGQIALALTGLPAGVTGTITTQPMINDTLGGEFQEVSVNLTIAATAAFGQYELALHATGAPVTLTTAAPILLTIAPPSFTITPSAGSFAIAKGSAAPLTVAIARVAFAGAVTLSAENLPAGVTAAFNPVSTTGDTVAATLSVSTAALPGNYTVTFRGKGNGPADFTSAVLLSIRPASGFELYAAPASIAAAAGGTGTTGIQAFRAASFSGAISYAVSGLPAGLTGVVTPTAVADSSVLTVTAAPSLAAGTYQVTVTGSAPGATTRQLVVAVTIQPTGIAAIHLDYSGCATQGRPLWVAYQDGAGSFTHVVGASNVYDFSFTQSIGALAIVRSTSLGFKTTITRGTQAELAAFSTAGALVGCASSVNGNTINATIVNEHFLVDVGIGGADGIADTTLRSTPIFNVQPGPQIATAMLLDPSAPKLILRRGQDITNGGSLAPFDFTTSEAVAPASGQVTGFSPIWQFAGYSNGAAGCHFTPLYSGAGFGSKIYGIPAALQQPGELHQFQLFAAFPFNVTYVTSYVHTIADQALQLGPALSASVTVNGGSFKQLNASMILPADYQSLGLDYTDSQNKEIYELTTPGYAGGNSLSLVTPALVGMPGYLTSWAPTGSVHYTVSASSLNLVLQSGAVCFDGLRVKGATQDGSM